jgi:NAD(P)-dependent dehydrogenase (short-subunit alcohol dehydrogenase family)
MDKLYDTGKQLINNSWFLWGTTLTIAFLALAKSYFKGGVCRIKRDLSGKVIVITGGNAGIGQATIEQLSQSKCTIIFGARDVRKSEEAIRSIKQKNKDADITFYPLDLADTKSILEFSSRVRKQVQHIDILVNNAAVFLLPQLTHTKQGYEMHMGVNHLGHFYLTYLLWPLIQQAHKPRIINVSALAHRGFKFPHNTNIPIEFDDLHLTNSYDPMLAYSRSKIANILFTKELQRRMDAANFEGFSYCLHPGVVRT